MKKCNMCLNEKPVTDFYKGKARCKACYNNISKQYNKENADRLRSYQKIWYYKTKSNPEAYQEYLAKRREYYKGRVA